MNTPSLIPDYRSANLTAAQSGGRTRGCLLSGQSLFPGLLLLLLLILLSCKDEEPDPIRIESALIHVSKYLGNDGAINLEISGGKPPYSILWSNGATTKDIDCLSAGNYVVNISDQASQFLSDTFLIEQASPDSLKISLEVHDVSRFGAGDGEIISSLTGGVFPYQYLWSEGTATPNLSGLDGGSYSLTVTDLVGVQISKSATVNEPGPNDILLDVVLTFPSYTGAADGAIDLTITGGFPPYGVTWSNGNDTEDLASLTAGTYAVSITDSESQLAERSYALSDSLCDIDENRYSIVKMGAQTWMGENLRVQHTSEGDFVNGYAYNNLESNVPLYGRLYTWNDAMAGAAIPGAQGSCPCGWHIPTDEELKELEIHLGMTQEEADMENTWRGSGVGAALKSGGDSGFDAMLSGRRSSGGVYSLINQYEYTWTSDSYGDLYAWRRCLSSSATTVGRWNTFPRSYAFSIRCIKNEEK